MTMAEDKGPVKVEVFAVSCAKCKRAEQVVITAVAELPDIDVEVEKKQDLFELRERGVMANPAVIIDGEIVSQGRIPSIVEIKELINKADLKRKSKI
jgi:small redox-active disulfide protein 2